MRNKYMKPRSTRRDGRTVVDRFRGGKLAPVMAVPFRESESGSLHQSVTFELDPIPGRMITPITAELICVYVPVQAMHALQNTAMDYPGNDEVIRQELLSGSSLFALEPENELTMRMGIEPTRISGVAKANRAARFAHNAAVNYLRRRTYVNAVQVDKDNIEVTPAILSKTVLERLNGVLDPEDRVNGAVDLNIPDQTMAVKGFGMVDTQGFANGTALAKESGGTGTVTYNRSRSTSNQGSFRVEEDPNNLGYPGIFADFVGSDQQVTLSDFYTAEKMDRLTREMREIVDNNPEHGEEIVTRFAHGLSLEVGKQPFVVYQKQHTFSMSLQRAMDGANLDTTQSNLVASIEFTAPIPATEFGGIVVTFAVVKPDEALANQPHPILSAPWGARNYVADEMAVDPVPVTIRELDSECSQVDEDTIALYVGNNHLLKTYVNYGFSRNLDTSTVAAKTAIWQLEVPMSVTPQSVLYPDDLDHYPFADQTAEVCSYTCSSMALVNTPIIFGPTPVEELAAIETEDVFEDAVV